MSAQQQYQGWANYPTWAVNLWLSNDEGLYATACEMAEDEITRGNSENVYNLASRLEDFVRELADLDEASFRADLLGYALDEGRLPRDRRVVAERRPRGLGNARS